MSMILRREILDCGYIQLVGSYGSDEQIIEAARMSTDKGFKGWGDESTPGDEKLLSYLWKNKHLTPFEMAGLTVEVYAPIFVFREWHRHRTQSYNEMSSRYVPLPDFNYLPSIPRLLNKQSGNKQASGIIDRVLNEADAVRFQQYFQSAYEFSQQVYDKLLNEGCSKELARLVIPVARYSKMRASANLRNWLAFLKLRMDLHAQWEIRQYANAISYFISDLFPRTYYLFLGEL